MRSSSLPPPTSASETACASSVARDGDDSAAVVAHVDRHRRVDLAAGQRARRARRAAPPVVSQSGDASDRSTPTASRAAICAGTRSPSVTRRAKRVETRPTTHTPDAHAVAERAKRVETLASERSSAAQVSLRRRERTSESGAFGAAAGELDRRRLDALDGPEDDLVVERVDHDRLAGVEFLPQDLLRERVLDHPLDRTAQRPGPERRVVALRRRAAAWRRW